MDFAIDPGFTHPPRYELGDLGTEIDDEDGVGGGVVLHGEALIGIER
jgi:hypothetical protein